MALNTLNTMNPNFTPASLYVGDLNLDVSEALLFEVFNSVGPVASIRVCRDVVTRRSLGYAYVNFHSVTDAERALDTMNFSNIRGRPCRIMWSQRDPSLRKSGVGNIFVKNLDKSIDHKTLYDTFSMFGNILSCKVATNEKGESLGYGFVHYETEEAAQKAIEKVDGMVIASHEVHVAPFKPRALRRGAESGSSFTNIYVKNLPVDINFEQFEAQFAMFGAITSAHLATDPATGKSKGFGFVNFDSADSATRAIDELREKPPLNLYIARAQKKQERLKELRDRFDKLRLEQAEKYAGINLYVKNLDDTIDDDRLRDEFKIFGEISSSKVMRDSNGRSKGFGFVCFTNREEATKAVTDMNGKLMCNKPLYVALAQRKEVRRQQLEQQASANRAKQTPAGMPQPQMYAAGTPMFYTPQVQQAALGRPGAGGGFMYPQQMIPQQRWNPRQQVPPQGMMPPNMYMMQQMPQVGGRGLPQQQQQLQQQQRAQGGVRGRGRGVAAGQVGQQGQPQQSRMKFTGTNRGVEFSDNARNQPAQRQQLQNQQQQALQQQGAVVGTTPGGPGTTPGNPAAVQTPLTSQNLANAPPQQQKQMIGERIFPLIQQRQPKLAGKITGMLLEMDNIELLHLLESKDELEAKITEAMTVLAAHTDPVAADATTDVVTAQTNGVGVAAQ